MIRSTTVTSQVADRSPTVAVIVAVPGLIARISPLPTTATTILSLLLQLTVLSVALSGLTVAVSVAFSPSVKDNAA